MVRLQSIDYDTLRYHYSLKAYNLKHTYNIKLKKLIMFIMERTSSCFLKKLTFLHL